MDKLFGDSRSIAQKPPLDPTSRAFQPKKFIRHALRGISHGDFEGKLVDQVSAEEKKTGEDLKQLIRDNLGIFIDSKEAMSAIYDQDQSLFTGEALQHITDAFKETEEACQTLVDPTMESFQDVQQSRKSQDILEKLYGVLSLPGLLYEYCGVRVAQTKVAEANSQQPSRHSSRIKLKSILRTGAQAQSSQRGAAPATDVNGAEEEGDEDTDVASDDGSDSAPRSPVMGFGALEGQLYAVNAAHRFLLYPGEELFFWFGTPLARIKNKDARRLHQDQVANYEGAVLCLRRAMLYMEENYDLEDGTLLAVESVGDGAPEPPASGDGGSVAAAAGAPSGGKRKVSAVSRSPFMYEFALALLRSALYLVDQLAVELVLANAADTVLIEDTLSMMMDVSIATVKLFSFCKVLQGVLMSKSDLTGLRDRLVESVDGGDTATTRGAAPFTATATNAATGGNDLHHPASKQQHPAEYFVAITRSQHTRLTIASATSLLREASMWMAKFAPSTAAPDTQPKDAATAGDDDNTPFNPTADGRGEAFTFSDVILGNINDSFAGNTNRPSGAATADQDELDTSVSMSLLGKQLQVGGFSVEQTAKSPIAVVEVQDRVESVLAAFQTPEMQFPSYTSFTIGTIDMADILESSCMQMLMHARNMLLQLSERADTETTVMAQGALLNTFAARLSEACMTNLEHIMVSYLGGIAATIHAGVFDFAPNPNSSLARMLQDVVASASPVAPQKPAGSAVSAFPSRSGSFAFQPGEDRAPPDAAAAANPTSPLITRAEKLPELKFVPVLPETPQLHNSSMVSSSTGSSLVAGQRMTLRDLSVGAVRRMVRSASVIMYSLFIAFVNRSVVSGFVRRMALYTVGDLTLHSKDELLELHAAILVEVVVGQWERVMTQVSDSVLRMKVAVGESCSTGTIKTEQQMKEMGELLSDLEQLRSSCFRCYIHGVGMLSKAYVTLFPMIQPGGGTVLEHRVRARLSRDFVSSPSTSKLLNLFSVVMDRTIPFLMRHIEVYDSADLFAAKEEDLETPEMASQAGGSSRRRVLRRRQNPRRPDAGSPTASADETAVRSDPITELVASAHARLVLEHLEEHEELLQALLSNLMLSFIDMLHIKCHSVTGNHHLEFGDRERDMMECMADALCLPTTVAPILLDHLLHPSLFIPTAALRTRNPREAAALVRAKYNAFQQQYLPRVGEHCQLAVDAMVNMYLAIPQQQITREVRQGGFMVPLFDWQRVTAHTCAAVRPYIAQCLIIVAQAHEALHWIHQPALAAAATQRLIGHLASTLATAISVDINAFEVSLECSHDFLLYGLLLIEAEAQTVLAVVQSILESITKNSATVGDVLPEVLLSRDCLQGVLQALWQQDTVACEAISAARAAAAAAASPAGGAKTESVYDAPLSRAERVARREMMTQAALEHLSYTVAAINTHLEEAPPACGLQRVSNEATQNIAERLAKRKEGYMGQIALRAEKAMKKAKAKEESAKQKRESEKDKEKGGQSKRSSRQPVAQLVGPPRAPTPPAAACPTEDSGPVDLTATLYQHAVNQETQQRKRVLRHRPERDTASPAAAATAPAVSPAMPTPEAPSPQPAAEEEAIPQRPPRRRHLTVEQPGEASGAPPPTRDRRANRFKRSSVV